MKIGLIATWLLLNSIICMSIEESDVFSSHLKQVVSAAVTAVFRIPGPNGECAHAHSVNEFRLNGCVVHPSQNFTFHSDGTLRALGRCITATALTQGSEVVQADCATASRNATVWRLQNHGVITNVASGLVLTAMFGTRWVKITLEKNMFSSYQTWRTLDYDPPVSSAYIIGMNGLCLRTLDGEVWLATCGSSGIAHRWLIYADGTIRPQQNSKQCLSFDNPTDKRVVVTICGLAPTSERWILTEHGTLLNERSGLVMDVAGADPSLRKILVYPPSGQQNQQWRIYHL